jgi:hypothetical protein
MEETLRKLQARRAIQRYRVSEDANGSLCVDAWMNGTSYIDDAVRAVRKTIENDARQENRRVQVMIAAILEKFEVEPGGAPVHRTYHQAVDKAD